MNNEKYLPPEPPAYGFTSAPPAAPPTQSYPPPGYSQQEYPQYGFAQPAYAPPPPQSYGAAPQQAYAPPPPQSYGATPHQPYAPPPALPQERLAGSLSRFQLNRPQTNVLSAVTFIFISGGMCLAWSVGFRNGYYYSLSNGIRVAWFVGAIIGAAISGFLPRMVPRRAITLFSALLVLIGGIVTASSSNSINALYANFYLNGIGNGLAFAPSLALAGELSVSYMRGKLSASTEQLSFNLGIFLQIVIIASWGPTLEYDEFHPDRVQGIISAAFGFFGLISAAMLFIESPVDLLISGREQAATDALVRLQCQPTPPGQTHAQLAEHKLYVAENNALSLEQSFVQGFWALLQLCVLRTLNAFSISSFMFYVLWLSTDSYSKTIQGAYIIFGGCRLLGSFFSSYLMDLAGRKALTLVGLLACSGLAFGMASQFVYPLYFYSPLETMLHFFAFFAGAAFAASSAYLSEAFPLKVKHNFISFAFIVELLVLIIITLCDVAQEFLYILGGIYTAVFVLSIWTLPETRRSTLRESQKKFRSKC